jgi:hypothetical protein
MLRRLRWNWRREANLWEETARQMACASVYWSERALVAELLLDAHGIEHEWARDDEGRYRSATAEDTEDLERRRK